MTTPQVLVFETLDELYEFAAGYLRQVADNAVQERGRFLLALSGGSTPEPLFRLLARPPYQTEMPWAETHIVWADERLVPANDPASNYGGARRLLLEHISIPTGQIYPIPGEPEPVVAAEVYANTLAELAGEKRLWPRLDLALLGMGSDGHTASLFPGSTFPIERPQAAMAVTAQYGDRPANRVTLTPGVFNDARHVLFLATGASKAEALATVLEGPVDPVSWPAQRIQPEDGRLLWLVDLEAASQLQQI